MSLNKAVRELTLRTGRFSADGVLVNGFQLSNGNCAFTAPSDYAITWPKAFAAVPIVTVTPETASRAFYLATNTVYSCVVTSLLLSTAMTLSGAAMKFNVTAIGK